MDTTSMKQFNPGDIVIRTGADCPSRGVTTGYHYVVESQEGYNLTLDGKGSWWDPTWFKLAGNLEGIGLGAHRTAELPSKGTPEQIVSNGYATAYYDIPPKATDLGHLIEHKKMSFNVGNIFKACYRLGDKAGTSPEYDLNKMIYFAQRELAALGLKLDPRG